MCLCFCLCVCVCVVCVRVRACVCVRVYERALVLSRLLKYAFICGNVLREWCNYEQTGRMYTKEECMRKCARVRIGFLRSLSDSARNESLFCARDSFRRCLLRKLSLTN